MAFFAFTAPILPGKRAQWDEFIGEITGPRRSEFNASRQRHGIHERTFLQETPMGDFVIVTLEGENPLGYMATWANTDDDFTRWFVQQVQEIHGFDLRQPPPTAPRQVVDSSTTSEGGEGREHGQMWAQLIKSRLRPGKEELLGRITDALEATEQSGSGLVRSTAFRDQNDPSVIYYLPVFESEAEARARENDPRRQEGLQGVRALMAEAFEGAPEFVDLELLSESTYEPAGATEEQNKAACRRIFDEAFADGNLAVIEELVSPDWVNIDPSLPEELRGHEGFRRLITIWRTGFPGFHLEIDDLVAEGDRVAVRFSFSGTHQGEFMGLPPTGRQVRGTGTGIFRFRDGKDVEHRVNFDALGVLQQLGVIPSPEQAPA
ncbi:MAG TPA: ester cyclase [Chloroflexota bacterium]|nr:ester cyclase [Chloroflexota bacterium]